MIERWLFIAIILGFGGGQANLPLPTTLEGFRSASTETQRLTLSRIATRDLQLPEVELARLVDAGLQHPDAGVRKRALSVIMSRAGLMRFDYRSETLAEWNRANPFVQAFRPRVIRMLNDPAEEVRVEAVLALGNLDYSPQSKRLALQDRTQQILADHYRSEDSGRVRAEIIQGLALQPTPTKLANETVLLALSDPSPSVRQSAARGAHRLPADVAIPVLIEYLRSPDRGVRFNGAHALLLFGRAAASALSALQAAVLVETDPVVRDEMQRAIAAITGARL